MSVQVVAAVSLALAIVPAAMILLNLRRYRVPPAVTATTPIPAISVLIPARNEERSIAASVEAALANRNVELDVVVLDDHSSDRTAEIVRAIATRDPRVRLVSAPPLPAGWCGKQHACHLLARQAAHDVLVFVDADVRLAPDALRRVAPTVIGGGAALSSGIPRQETAGLLERLVVPLIHFVLLGFLPIGRMRRSTHPSYAAGCGQLFVTTRRAYETAGGHAAIRASRHDGVTLPRAYRRAGLATDLFDATPLATCRMYRSSTEVWNGFAKNANEGMASAAAIGPWTALLGAGQLLPWLLALAPSWPTAAIAAAVIGVTARVLLALRFRQSILGALLHPAGVAVVLAIQWTAFGSGILGRSTPWKGRQVLEG